MKYIFVMGGVVSGLGKGITAASLGRLLKARGYQVTLQKLDPYLNVDPGTMNPVQHGEVFVTEDGTETDLDLGHYERFLDENLNRNSNVTTGKIYSRVLRKEREGLYGGGTVQVIPHITNEIKEVFVRKESTEKSVAIIEVGGTVGDIESQPYLEAIRQFRRSEGEENVLLMLVSYVPYLRCSRELKSKPTQAAVRTMQEMGLWPDIIICRTEVPLTPEIRNKIAHFCNVEPDHVLENRDLDCLYEVPLALEEEHLAEVVCRNLKLSCPEPELSEWRSMVNTYRHPAGEVRIALVGKYTQLRDSYLSVTEALIAGGIASNVRISLQMIEAEEITEETAESLLQGYQGILIPGGFGERGIPGMLTAIRYAREHLVPLLGLCLGMQLICIEFARNVCGLPLADSLEFSSDTPDPIIHLMPDQEGVVNLGGTLRRGSYPCVLEEGSLIESLYGTRTIEERHRHRYEFNNSYRDMLCSHGLRLSGQSPDGRIVEMIELPGHPFFVGTQSHPEFKSRPNRSHPLFRGFVKAVREKSDQKNETSGKP